MADTTTDPTQIRETLKEWISLDDQLRILATQAKAIRQRKTELGANVIQFMKGSNLDNFVLEGPGGSISRSVRTSRPALKRETIRTQLLLQFADQPQRVIEALRAIEGIQEGDDVSVGGTQKDVLMRRLPKTQRINLS